MNTREMTTDLSDIKTINLLAEISERLDSERHSCSNRDQWTNTCKSLDVLYRYYMEVE